jgi:hypothetical protein
MITSSHFSLEGPFSNQKRTPTGLSCKTPNGLSVELRNNPAYFYADLRISQAGFEVAIVLGADDNGQGGPDADREDLVDMVSAVLLNNETRSLPVLWRPGLEASLDDIYPLDAEPYAAVFDEEDQLYIQGPFSSFQNVTNNLYTFHCPNGIRVFANATSNTITLEHSDMKTELIVKKKHMKKIVHYITTQIRTRELRTLAEIAVAPRELVEGPESREGIPLNVRRPPPDITKAIAKFLGGSW